MYYFILLIFLAFDFALASPAGLTYQGRIVKSDGTALEYSNVSFIFQITNPSGSCVIYQEQVTGYNMASSKGVFDVSIGGGTVSWPSGGGFSVLDSFNNSSSFSCGSCSGYSCSAGSSSYSPLTSDGRLLRVQFYDGNGWKMISPETVIRSVPFAGYSLSARKLGDHESSAFVLKNEINGNVSCDSGSEFLTWDATTKTFGCSGVSGSNGGTLTEVTVSSPLSVTNAQSTPHITLPVASSSQDGYLSSSDWVVFNNKLSASSSFGGDISGTASSISVDKLKGTALSVSSLSSGQYLKYNGTNWINSSISQSDVTGLSTALSGMLMQSQFPASCATNQTLTFLSPSGSFSCSNIAISGSQVSGNISGNAAGFTGSLSGDVTGGQSSTVVARLQGRTVSSGTPLINQILKYDGTQWAPMSLSSSDLPSGTLSGSGTAGYVPYYSSANGLANSVMFQAGDNVGIGTVSPTSPLHIVSNGLSGSTPEQMMDRYSDDAVGPFTVTRKARGTRSSPLAVNVGDDIGGMYGRGYGTTGFGVANVGAIKISAEETFTDSAQGTRISFGTTPIGGTSRSERMRITHSGNVGIGTINPAYKLDVSGIINSTTTIRSEYRLQVARNAASFEPYIVLTDKYLQSAVDGTTPLSAARASGGLYFKKPPADTSLDDVNGLGLARLSAIAQPDLSGDLHIGAYNASGGTSAMIYLDGSANNVGIGTSSPTAKLEVAGTIKATAFEGPLTATTSSSGAGSNTNPSMTFSGDTDTGFYNTTSNNQISVAAGGVNIFNFSSLGLVSSATGGASVSSANGTASAPTFSFAGDTNTGWYRPAEDTMAAATGGVERVRIDSSGNVGIGTANPGAKLELNRDTTSASNAVTTPDEVLRLGWNDRANGVGVDSGAGVGVKMTFFAPAINNGLADTEVANMGIFRESGTEGSLANALTFSTHNGTSLQETLRITGSGRVGVGTASPSQALHVHGSSNLGTSADNTNILVSSANRHSGIQLDGASAYGSAMIFSSALSEQGRIHYGLSTNYLSFHTNAAGAAQGGEAMRIISSGNVGIGTTAPSSKLEVSGSVAGASGIKSTNSEPTGYAELTAVSDNAGIGIAAYGSTNTTAISSVSMAGAVGISTFSSTGYQPTSMFVGTKRAIPFYLITNNAIRMTADGTGNIGIGTTAPSQKLHVVGNLRVQGTTDCTLGNGSGGTSCSSDLRLKENILPISHALDKITSLRGVEFDWNQKSLKPGEHAMGVIAQEVEKRFPTAVSEDLDSGFKKVDYAVLVAPLIEAVKELYVKLQDLAARKVEKTEFESRLADFENENARLKKENEEFRRRLERLEKAISSSDP